MRNSEGFVQADSTNLPRVETIMMIEFMQNSEKYNLAGIRGAKASLSSRASYVQNAVGYVEIKRKKDICFVQCRITPEHKVHNKMYQVSAEVNETEEKIVNVICHDCAASEGGCKHALCLLMWLVKRTEEPSTTSTVCYWKRPVLSAAVTQGKFILCSAMGKRKQYECNAHVPSLQDFLEEARNHKMNDCLIMDYNIHEKSVHDYCIFQIMLNYVSKERGLLNFTNFKAYANNIITDKVIALVESRTREQVNSKSWHSLRQSRVTASKIYEATKCRTEEGALVQSIMGGYKVPETAAIKRGKKLENEVLRVIEKDLKVAIHKSGFVLVTPLIGASPDGISKDFIVEVKYPSTAKTMENYINKNVSTQWPTVEVLGPTIFVTSLIGDRKTGTRGFNRAFTFIVFQYK
ncbi:uncharacterized protein LOC134670972 [Cydia fagiglandana]|uniref:uncharacterized protein LOC134670972 n=1 Tax=Cydia fagiglandana TaxID=1458189 RepID=UPI002FEE1C73